MSIPEIGARVRVISDEQVRYAGSGISTAQGRARIVDPADRVQSEDTIHCNGWEPIAVGDEGVVVPQYPNDGGPASLQWSDGTILVRRADDSLFSIWPECVIVIS